MHETHFADRRSQAPVHLVTARANLWSGLPILAKYTHFKTIRGHTLAGLFTDYRMPGQPFRTRYKHFMTICEHMFDNSPIDSSSSLFGLMIIQART